MRTPEEIVPAFEAVNRAQAQAMYVIDSPSFFTHRTTLLGLAAHRAAGQVHAHRQSQGRAAARHHNLRIHLATRRRSNPVKVPPDKAINLTVQQRRFACCWPTGYRRRSADSNGKLQLLKNAIVLNARPDPEPGDVLILQKVEGTISEGHAGGPDAVAIVNR